MFFIGCIGYSLLEILWRGYTHWTMTLTGGICFIILYHAYLKYENIALWQKCLIGAVIITSIEFIVGCIVNIWLKWNVWDYSALQFNLFGQICLFYSTLWFFVSLPLVFLSSIIRKRISH